MLQREATKEECEIFGTHLRKETMKYLDLHPELLTETAVQNFLADQPYNVDLESCSIRSMQQIFDDLIDHYSKKETYADNFIVQIVAKMLNANIVILRQEEDLAVTTPSLATTTTYYLYLNNEHYQSIALPTGASSILEDIATQAIENAISSVLLEPFMDGYAENSLAGVDFLSLGLAMQGDYAIEVV